MNRKTGLRIVAAMMACAAMVIGAMFLRTVRMEEAGQYLPVYLPSMQEGSLALSGNARVSDGSIVLTEDAASQLGSAYSRGIALQPGRSFSALFSFRMFSQDSGGDGLMFVLREPGAQPSEGQAIQGMKKSLAVEFDTRRDPALPIEIEPEENHVAVVIDGDPAQPVKVRALGASLVSGETYYAWVEYADGVLELRLDTVATRPEEALLVADVPPEAIPAKVEVGFAAMTQEQHAQHVVSSLLFGAQAKPLSMDRSYVPDARIALSFDEAALGGEADVDAEGNPVAAPTKKVRYALYAHDGDLPIAGVPVALAVDNGASIDHSSGITDEQGMWIVEVSGGESTADAQKTTLSANGPGSASAKVAFEGLQRNTPPEVQQAEPDRIVGFEDSQIGFQAGRFEMYYIDADGDAFAGIVIDSVPEVGELLVRDEIVRAGDWVPAEDTDALTYLPPAGYSTADGAPLTFTWRVHDGLTASANTGTCEIEVRHINHAPSFECLGDVGMSTSTNDRARTIENWAYNMDPGAPSESDQRLTFEVLDNDNPDLFEVQPAISELGTLTFTLAVGKQGVARLRVRLLDDGGTSDGGDDASDPVSFHIRFDDEAPIVTLPVVRSGWIGEPIWERMTCIDEGSGVKSFAYAVTDTRDIPARYDSQAPQARSGEFYIHARAEDNAGNVLTKAFGPFAIDLEPPTAPTLTLALEGGALHASAYATDEHAGVKLYQFGVNGLWRDATPSSSLEIRDLVANTEYTVAVRAIDGAGNASIIAFAAATTPPNAPKLDVTKRNGSVLIAIDPNGNAADTLYRLERIDKKTGEVTKFWEGSSALAYSDDPVSGAQYRVEVMPRASEEVPGGGVGDAGTPGA